MDIYERKCTCGDDDCARTLTIEPVYRVTVADEADRISATEFLSRAGLLDWLSSDCVIQDARNELSIDPDAYEVQQWLDSANEVAELRRQLATAELERDAAQDAVVGLQAERAALLALLEDERQRTGHANNWRNSAILEANEARAEAAALRRQLAEERMRANAAEFAVAQLRSGAAELRRQLAEMTKMRDAAARGVEIREEIFERKRTEFKEALQRMSALIDDEANEFNAGYDACKSGQPIESEPECLVFDVWRHGWMVADYDRLAAVPVDAIADLYTAYSYAAAGKPAAQEFPQVGRWLGILPAADTDTPHRPGKGDTR